MRRDLAIIIAISSLTLAATVPALADDSPREALPVPQTGHSSLTSSPPSPAGPATGTVTILKPGQPVEHPQVLDDRAVPVAFPDAYLVQSGEVLDVSAVEGLLKNDLDPDGDPIIVTSIVAPSHGTLDIATDGSFTYTPDAGFEGNETLSYTISDGNDLGGPGVLDIEILPPINRAPVSVADSYVVETGTVLTVSAEGGLLSNDYDPDGDTMVVTAIVVPANGSIEPLTDGSFTYTPDAGFVGSEVVQYQVSDGMQLNDIPGQLSIEVLPSSNRAPIGRADYWYTPSNTTLEVAGDLRVVHNDLDPDGDAFSVAAYTPADHGDLSVFADGRFVYTPDAGFEGEDAFSYRLLDDSGTLSSGLTTVALVVGIFGDLPTGVLTPPEAFDFRLQTATPNPFNPTTELAFELASEGPVALRVYNVRGEVVAILVDEVLPAGAHTAVWNGRDTEGRRLASGTYVAELRSGTQRAVRKLTLVK
jgi:hypothetical protein